MPARKTIVLGGTGLIGSSLARRLTREGTEVVAVSRHPPVDRHSGVEYVQSDLEDEDALERLVRRADCVYSLAWSRVPGNAFGNEQADLVENVCMVIRQVKACVRGHVGRFVFLSSGGTVYGSSVAEQICEDHPTEPLSSYGVSKLAAEYYVLLWNRLHGLDAVVARPGNVFGESFRVGVGQGIIGTALKCCLTGEILAIWGSGKLIRDYVYVGDCAEALVQLGQVGPLGKRVFNIGTGLGTSVLDVLFHIHEVTGRSVPTRNSPGRLIDVERNVLCSCRLTDLTGWHPECNLATGIARTWEWLLAREEALAGAASAVGCWVGFS